MAKITVHVWEFLRIFSIFNLQKLMLNFDVLMTISEKPAILKIMS